MTSIFFFKKCQRTHTYTYTDTLLGNILSGFFKEITISLFQTSFLSFLLHFSLYFFSFPYFFFLDPFAYIQDQFKFAFFIMKAKTKIPKNFQCKGFDNCHMEFTRSEHLLRHQRLYAYRL